MKTTVFAPKPVVNLVDGPKVGDVLVGTYGYEASIAVFAQVVKVMGKSVSVVELETNDVYKPNSGGMYWTSTPVLTLTNPLRDRPWGATKRVIPHGYRYCIKWTNYMHLWPWDGKPLECYNVH